VSDITAVLTLVHNRGMRGGDVLTHHVVF